MNTIRPGLATLAAAAILLAAVPASASTSIGGKVFLLRSEGGSGENGTVALKPLGQQTAVEVHVVNVPAGVSQTVHIHEGTCAKVAPQVKYPLSPVIDGTSESIIDVPLDKLLATPLVVHVHRTYKQERSSVACASIGPT